MHSPQRECQFNLCTECEVNVVSGPGLLCAPCMERLNSYKCRACGDPIEGSRDTFICSECEYKKKEGICTKCSRNIPLMEGANNLGRCTNCQLDYE